MVEVEIREQGESRRATLGSVALWEHELKTLKRDWVRVKSRDAALAAKVRTFSGWIRWRLGLGFPPSYRTTSAQRAKVARWREKEKKRKKKKAEAQADAKKNETT